MKHKITAILLAAMCLGLVSGCKPGGGDPPPPDGGQGQPVLVHI